jgi:hypothetical protein
MRVTHSRFRKRVRYWGVEGGVLPLVGSAAASGMLALYTTQSGTSFGTYLSVLPFALTFTYYAVFVTGRRPHFRDDLWGLCLRGRSQSPPPSRAQPLHPSLSKSYRGSRHAVPQEG